MCQCKNIKMGSYDNQSSIMNPFNKEIVSIDNCILPEIISLWKKGIRTYGSCCGHNITVPSIAVDSRYEQEMKKLGYKKLYCPFNKEIYLSKTLFINPWFLFKIEIVDRIKYEVINKIFKRK